MKASRACRCGAIVIALWQSPTVLAQGTFDSDVGTSASRWWRRWSPLRGFGTGELPVPTPPATPGTLELLDPRAGLFWTAGNPAALFDEIDSARAFMVVDARSVSGSYHRPLDAPTATRAGLSIGGWRRIGPRSAAIGRVAVERENVSEGTYATSVVPYGFGPFMPADTTAPALVRPIVTLEGAQGIAFGKWRFGIGAGYQALENNSSRGGAAHVGRRSAAGVTVGAVRRIQGRWSASVLARHRSESEVVTLVPNPAKIRVYALDGYLSVPPSDYTPLTDAFFRRADLSSTVVGGGLSGYHRRTAWVLYAEERALDERQVADLSSNPPKQLWRTRGYAGGAAAQWFGRDKRLTMHAEYSAQRGETAAATRQAPFSTASKTLTAGADGRYLRTGSPWGAAGSLSLVGGRREANDRAAAAATNISSWQPAGAVELIRRVRRDLNVAVAYGMAYYTPYVTIPEPRGRGVAYENLIAPAIEMAAAGARSQQEAATIAWQRGAGRLTLRIWRATVAPMSRPSNSLVPLPEGTRTTWGVALVVQ